MLQNGIKITAVCVGETILLKFTTVIILKPFKNPLDHFYHGVQERDKRFILFERRRATL